MLALANNKSVCLCIHVRIFILCRISGVIFLSLPRSRVSEPCPVFALLLQSSRGDAVPHVLLHLDSISSVHDQVAFLLSAPASYSLPLGLAALHPNSFPQQAALCLKAIYFHAGIFTFPFIQLILEPSDSQHKQRNPATTVSVFYVILNTALCKGCTKPIL